mmetsp:Transcript_51040/g.116039  ORF Transcript_51040/g.116039 Transcript_51040/m.116039 type:complete len:258 (+) Transcript_51040:546-1319(+)
MYFSSISLSWSSRILAPSLSSTMMRSRAAARFIKAPLRARRSDTSCWALPQASLALALAAASCLRWSMSFSTCCDSARTLRFASLVPASASSRSSFSALCRSKSWSALLRSTKRSSAWPMAFLSSCSRPPHRCSSRRFFCRTPSRSRSRLITMAAASTESVARAVSPWAPPPPPVRRAWVALISPVPVLAAVGMSLDVAPMSADPPPPEEPALLASASAWATTRWHSRSSLSTRRRTSSAILTNWYLPGSTDAFLPF